MSPNGVAWLVGIGGAILFLLICVGAWQDKEAQTATIQAEQTEPEPEPERERSSHNSIYITPSGGGRVGGPAGVKLW